MAEPAATLPKNVPPEIQSAVLATEQEIATLACEIDQRQQRIAKLRAFIENCRQHFDGAWEGGTYAEVAMSLLAAARRPLSTAELLDAMSVAGRPVNGASRKHRLRTLITSLNRARAVVRKRNGWWLRGVPMATESANAS